MGFFHDLRGIVWMIAGLSQVFRTVPWSGVVAQLLECLLTMLTMKLWAPSVTPHESCMVVPACNLSMQEVEAGQSFKTILSYTVSVRPAWATLHSKINR